MILKKIVNLKKFIKTLTTPIQFNNNLPKFINIISNKINFNLKENTTCLHRWCHTSSDKYKFSCKWQKKIDDANNDNNLSKF
tara:strand:+ start:2789 stop:3034 length:246 start_codon:yes stop_codon:yes gene_type:complete